jgi:hypothetical protein
MLPFVTRTDLNDAATRAHVSHEVRNIFLKVLMAEHSKNGAREQLKQFWSAWVDKNYASAAPHCAHTTRLSFWLRTRYWTPELEGVGALRSDGGAGEVAALPKARWSTKIVTKLGCGWRPVGWGRPVGGRGE